VSRAPTPRVVLDTQVALDLLHFADPRTQGLRAAIASGDVGVVTDAACRAEWHRVLHYPALRLDAARRALLELDYDALCVVVDDAQAAPIVATALPRCADPDDQKFLELAHRSGAIALLTRDRDLLALARRCAREGRFAILPAEALTGLVGTRLVPPSLAG
jgi:putative PIN family toxin of toxin-antitoxin system